MERISDEQIQREFFKNDKDWTIKCSIENAKIIYSHVETKTKLSKEEKLSLYKEFCMESGKAVANAQLAANRKELDVLEAEKAQKQMCINNLRQQLIEQQKELEEVVELLGLHENELGFCEISNHVPYSELAKYLKEEQG